MPETRQAGGRAKRAAGNLVGIVLMLAVLAAACACALYVHANGIGSWEAFVGLTAATTVAQALFTLMFDGRFGRPTNGTSGRLGLAMIWIVVRAAAVVAIAVCGLAGACAFVTAYLAAVIVGGVCDVLLIVTGL